MNNYSNLNSYINCGVNSDVMNGANSANLNNNLHVEHYTTMDLCSQAQMSDEADNILNRMHKLRVFASEQQAKRVKSQRQQTSFCF
ncbi:MAG: hypothetical protein ACJASL_004151 [Paraglaciecola sp.]